MERTYTVQKGDTLAAIAARNGVELPDLIRFNKELWSRPGRSPDQIFVGDSVVIREARPSIDLSCSVGINPLFRCTF